jgi:hypothetical protein
VRNPKIFIDEEIKGQREMIDELLMALRIPGIDPVGFGVQRSELLNITANGRELVLSAGRHVLGIEKQQSTLLALKVRQRHWLPARPEEREIRCFVSDSNHRSCSLFLHPDSGISVSSPISVSVCLT